MGTGSRHPGNVNGVREEQWFQGFRRGEYSRNLVSKATQRHLSVQKGVAWTEGLIEGNCRQWTAASPGQKVA